MNTRKQKTGMFSIVRMLCLSILFMSVDAYSAAVTHTAAGQQGGGQKISALNNGAQSITRSSGNRMRYAQDRDRRESRRRYWVEKDPYYYADWFDRGGYGYPADYYYDPYYDPYYGPYGPYYGPGFGPSIYYPRYGKGAAVGLALGGLFGALADR